VHCRDVSCLICARYLEDDERTRFHICVRVRAVFGSHKNVVEMGIEIEHWAYPSRSLMGIEIEHSVPGVSTYEPWSRDPR
jgi:hypothetical protein